MRSDNDNRPPPESLFIMWIDGMGYVAESSVRMEVAGFGTEWSCACGRGASASGSQSVCRGGKPRSCPR